MLQSEWAEKAFRGTRPACVITRVIGSGSETAGEPQGEPGSAARREDLRCRHAPREGVHFEVICPFKS